MSKSKQKGTLAETALVKWLHAHGVDDAKRQPLSGNKDIGDVASHEGRVVWEVKNYNGSASLGQPSEKQLDAWLEQAWRERANAGAQYGLLVVKRKGTTDVGRWWAYWLTVDYSLATCTEVQVVPDSWLCMSVESALAILNNGVAFRDQP